jgi:hypothetical protein
LITAVWYAVSWNRAKSFISAAGQNGKTANNRCLNSHAYSCTVDENQYLTYAHTHMKWAFFST